MGATDSHSVPRLNNTRRAEVSPSQGNKKSRGDRPPPRLRNSKTIRRVPPSRATIKRQEKKTSLRKDTSVAVVYLSSWQDSIGGHSPRDHHHVPVGPSRLGGVGVLPYLERVRGDDRVQCGIAVQHVPNRPGVS